MNRKEKSFRKFHNRNDRKSYIQIYAIMSNKYRKSAAIPCLERLFAIRSRNPYSPKRSRHFGQWTMDTLGGVVVRTKVEYVAYAPTRPNVLAPQGFTASNVAVALSELRYYLDSSLDDIQHQSLLK